MIKGYFNPTALNTAKTPKSSGHSECNRVKECSNKKTSWGRNNSVGESEFKS